MVAASSFAQSLEGRIVNSKTGEGIAGMKITIARSDAIYPVTSGPDGRFSLDNLSDGSYTARYVTEGYWPAPSQPVILTERNQFVQHFQVLAAAGSAKLEARLMPLARVAIQVVDHHGKPIPHARLEIEGPAIQLSTGTDADGKFNSQGFALFPGAYTLSASPIWGQKPPEPDPETGRTLAWARSYYPGIATRDAATKVLLDPGQTRDMQIEMVAVPAHALRGVVLDLDGRPAPGVKLSLGYDMPLVEAESKPDGTFEFPSLPDGEFAIRAEIPVSASRSGDNQSVSNAQIPGSALYVRERVTVSERDLEGVTLMLTEPFVVHGKTVIETPPGIDPPPPPTTIWLREKWGPEDQFPGRQLSNQPDALGNFVIAGVYPGLYSITASAPPSNYYLDSIHIGDVEARTAIARVDFPQGITLIYKSNGGFLRGSVEKCAGGRVWLFPADPALTRPDLRVSAICDANDRYAFNSIRPGEYYAIALSSDRPWLGKMADALIPQSTSITIRPTEITTADLRPPIQP